MRHDEYHYKTYEIKFFDRIRGALTAAPTSELPVKKIPQAAPTMDKPRPNATPNEAKPYGDMWVNTSAHPWLQNSLVQVAEDMVRLAVVVVVTRTTKTSVTRVYGSNN